MSAETTIDRKTGVARFKKRAQVAKHIVIALPSECSDAERKELTERYVREEFVAHGAACEWAIHLPDDDARLNFHAHLLVTTRAVQLRGFGKKVLSINPFFAHVGGRRFVAEDDRLTQRWANTQRIYFHEKGLKIEVEPFGSEIVGRKRVHLGPTWHMPDADRMARQAAILKEAERLAETRPDVVLDALTAKHATFMARDVERVLRKAGLRGGELMAARATVLSQANVLRLATRSAGGIVVENGRFTTGTVRAQELKAVSDADTIAGQPHAVEAAAIDRAGRSLPLNAEQLAVLGDACRTGGLAVIEGLAGARKNDTTSAIADAHRGSGYDVVAFEDLGAPTSPGIRKPATIRLALIRQKSGRDAAWNRRTAIMVDEAAMSDSATLSRLLEQVALGGSKLILVCDNRQSAAVIRGGLFAEIRQRHSLIGHEYRLDDATSSLAYEVSNKRGQSTTQVMAAINFAEEVARWLAALPAVMYRIVVGPKAVEYNWSGDELNSRLCNLAQEAERGASISARPIANRYLLLKEVSQGAIVELKRVGFGPVLAIDTDTGAGQFAVWLDLGIDPTEEEAGYLAEVLALRFGAVAGSLSPLPGFASARIASENLWAGQGMLDRRGAALLDLARKKLVPLVASDISPSLGSESAGLSDIRKPPDHIQAGSKLSPTP